MVPFPTTSPSASSKSELQATGTEEHLPVHRMSTHHCGVWPNAAERVERPEEETLWGPSCHLHLLTERGGSFQLTAGLGPLLIPPLVRALAIPFSSYHLLSLSMTSGPVSSALARTVPPSPAATPSPRSSSYPDSAEGFLDSTLTPDL